MVYAHRVSDGNPSAHHAPAIAGALPSPLTAQLCAAIGERWTHGAGFAAIADDLVDVVAEHIRSRGIRGAMDARLAHAIADAISDHADHEHAPAPVAGQLTLDSILACPVCRDARRTAERGWCSACDGAWPIDDRAVSL